MWPAPERAVGLGWADHPRDQEPRDSAAMQQAPPGHTPRSLADTGGEPVGPGCCCSSPSHTTLGTGRHRLGTEGV